MGTYSLLKIEGDLLITQCIVCGQLRFDWFQWARLSMPFHDCKSGGTFSYRQSPLAVLNGDTLTDKAI